MSLIEEIENLTKKGVGDGLVDSVQVRDVSHNHAGHYDEAVNGGTHFKVRVLLSDNCTASKSSVLMKATRATNPLYKKYPKLHSITFKVNEPI